MSFTDMDTQAGDRAGTVRAKLVCGHPALVISTPRGEVEIVGCGGGVAITTTAWGKSSMAFTRSDAQALADAVVSLLGLEGEE